MDQRYYIFDIDGTLTHIGDRIKCLDGDQPDHDQFYARISEDKPNRPVINILNCLLDHGYRVLLLSNRRRSTEDETLAWLSAQGVYIDREQLLLRNDNDFRPDVEVKPYLLMKAGLGVEDIIAVFEDRARMVKFWRDNKVPCFQVADGNF